VTPLASGRTADVFAVDERRVLRRYRGERDVAGEAAVMTHVEAHGFPVPKVYRASGRDMVLERLPGLHLDLHPCLAAFLRHARWRPPGMLDRAQEYRRRDPVLTADEIDRLPAAAERVRAAAAGA
jgi:hypothetical protein